MNYQAATETSKSNKETLSQYERLRLKNIERNQARLKALGLDSSSNKISKAPRNNNNNNNNNNTKASNKTVKEQLTKSVEPVRRSGRKRRPVRTNINELLSEFDDDSMKSDDDDNDDNCNKGDNELALLLGRKNNDDSSFGGSELDALEEEEESSDEGGVVEIEVSDSEDDDSSDVMVESSRRTQQKRRQSNKRHRSASNKEYSIDSEDDDSGVMVEASGGMQQKHLKSNKRDRSVRSNKFSYQYPPAFSSFTATNANQISYEHIRCTAQTSYQDYEKILLKAEQSKQESQYILSMATEQVEPMGLEIKSKLLKDSTAVNQSFRTADQALKHQLSKLTNKKFVALTGMVKPPDYILHTHDRSNTNHLVVMTGSSKLDKLSERKKAYARRMKKIFTTNEVLKPGPHSAFNRKNRRCVRETHNPDAPPEIPNSGYSVWLTQITHKIRQERGVEECMNQAKIVKEVAKIWSTVLSEEEKKEYYDIFKDLKLEHNFQSNEYRATGAFTPSKKYMRLKFDGGYYIHSSVAWIRADPNEQNVLEKQLVVLHKNAMQNPTHRKKGQLGATLKDPSKRRKRSCKVAGCPDPMNCPGRSKRTSCPAFKPLVL